MYSGFAVNRQGGWVGVDSSGREDEADFLEAVKE